MEDRNTVSPKDVLDCLRDVEASLREVQTRLGELGGDEDMHRAEDMAEALSVAHEILERHFAGKEDSRLDVPIRPLPGPPMPYFKASLCQVL